MVDKKSLGYFSMKELKNLLEHYKFEIDKQYELLEAFRELRAVPASSPSSLQMGNPSKTE